MCRIASVWIALLLCLSTALQAQFLRTYNRCVDNFGRVVLAMPDGGAFFAGAGTDSLGYLGTQWDFFIRTDSLGDTLWTRQLRGTDLISMGASADFVGNIYSAGIGYSAVNGVSSPIIKMGPGGQVLWAKAIDNLHIEDITVSLDGGCIAAGFMPDGLGFTSDVDLLRMDSLGNVLWHNYYTFANDEWGYAVCQGGDSSIYVCGQWAYASIRTALVLKVHPNGSLIWCKSFSLPTGNSFGNWIAATPNGFNFLATCWQNGHMVFIQCDTSGNIFQATEYASPNRVRGEHFCPDGQGGYILSGLISDPPSPRLHILLVHIDSLGHVLQSSLIRSAVINVQGNIACVTKAAGAGFYASFSSDSMGYGKSAVMCRFTDLGGLFCHNQVSTISDSSYFVAVSTFPPGLTQSLPVRNASYYSTSGTVVSEPCGNPLGIGYPESGTNFSAAIVCNEYCSVQIPFSGEVKGSIYDLSGRMVLKVNGFNKHMRFSTSDFVPGMYVLSAFGVGYEARFKFFVAH